MTLCAAIGNNHSKHTATMLGCRPEQPRDAGLRIGFGPLWLQRDPFDCKAIRKPFRNLSTNMSLVVRGHKSCGHLLKRTKPLIGHS
jgi:hypothetical protein